MSARSKLGDLLRARLKDSGVDDRGLEVVVPTDVLELAGLRTLCAVVRANGRVVLFVRGTSTPAFEMSGEEWLRQADRVAQAIRRPELYGGAVLALGVERPPAPKVEGLEHLTPEAMQRALAPLAEPDPDTKGD